jgi:hypothetical protein
MTQATDEHQQLLAMALYHWTAEEHSLYDAEGVEGWAWVEPDGTEHTAVGEWDNLPPWPESARLRITKLEAERTERSRTSTS